MDRQDLRAAVLDAPETFFGWTQMALRILPAEFRQFPRPQGGFHLQPLEEDVAARVCQVLAETQRMNSAVKVEQPQWKRPQESGLLNEENAELRPGQKNDRGFTARFIDPPACRRSIRRPARFYAGLEPKTRSGLSLARDDACAPLRGHRSRPAPSFSRYQNSVSEPADSELHRSVRFRKPRPGRYRRSQPVACAVIRHFSDSFRLHSPSGHWNLPDQSRSAGISHQKARLCDSTGLFSAPRCAFFRWRFGSSQLETRFVSFGYRSVNPGTGYDHAPECDLKSKRKLPFLCGFLRF